MTEKLIDIEDRQKDYKFIKDEVWRTELGIRSICVMYDEHSSDRKSKENIFLLKDNIHYRLFSTVHQYLVFLRELGLSEKQLQELHKNDPKLLNAFPFGNPNFEKVELELSALFDSIIFQLSSVFDYLSHLICYICKTNKSDTFYWTKLASSARGSGNELSELMIKNTIDQIDRAFVGKLYDYRSRLLHNKRDQHKFNSLVELSELSFNVRILASDIALKHFKYLRNYQPDGEITLTFLSSWIIKQSFIEIEKILDSLRSEIYNNSNFHKNLIKPKTENGFMIVSIDPETKLAKPVSDLLWTQYKKLTIL